MLAVALVRYWLMLEVLYVGSSTCTVLAYAGSTLCWQ